MHRKGLTVAIFWQSAHCVKCFMSIGRGHIDYRLVHRPVVLCPCPHTTTRPSAPHSPTGSTHQAAKPFKLGSRGGGCAYASLRELTPRQRYVLMRSGTNHCLVFYVLLHPTDTVTARWRSHANASLGQRIPWRPSLLMLPSRTISQWHSRAHTPLGQLIPCWRSSASCHPLNKTLQVLAQCCGCMHCCQRRRHGGAHLLHTLHLLHRH